MSLTVDLPIRAAVPLGHAWAQRVADDLGIRLLALKGPTLTAHRLRPDRTSGDVDVLVEPARFAEYIDALSQAGWQERPSTFASSRFTLYSRSLIHPSWPCDLDVHHSFPGFLADPSEVFDLLWERRTTTVVARQECAIPDRLGSLLILALHSLRGGTNQPRHRAELEHLVSTVRLTEEEREELGDLARRTRCAATLDEVLPRLGVTAGPSPDELASPELREWRERVAAGGYGTYFWFAALRKARARDRAVIAVRAVWPSDHDLLANHPDTPDTVPAKLWARARRYGRGVQTLPAAVRALRSGRGNRPSS